MYNLQMVRVQKRMKGDVEENRNYLLNQAGNENSSKLELRESGNLLKSAWEMSVN